MDITRRGILAASASALAGLALPARARELFELAGRPQQIETPLAAFVSELTDTSDFFVRSHFGPPRLNVSRPIEIAGHVQQTLRIDAKALRRYPLHDVTAVAQCAGSGRRFSSPRVPGVQWGHGAMGQARWRGVRLSDVLEDAGVDTSAAHIGLAGADLPPLPSVPAFVRSIPLERALKRDTLIALEMNGAPLDLNHGAPARLVVPGWAADHWVKWLSQIEVRKEEAPGYFMQTAYRLPKTPVPPGSRVAPKDTRPVHTIPVKSVIARPAEGDSHRTGSQEIVGVAFSGDASIERVEVSLDAGESWRAATLSGDPGVGRWQVFRFQAHIEKTGPITAWVRARDTAGNEQPQKPDWNPSGYLWNGWHAVTWSIV